MMKVWQRRETDYCVSGHWIDQLPVGVFDLSNTVFRSSPLSFAQTFVRGFARLRGHEEESTGLLIAFGGGRAR
jgi:hypothetical protein